MTERDVFLGHRRADQQRLQRQAQELADESRDFFGRIGIGAGQQAALAEMQARLRGLLGTGTLVLSHLFVQVWARKPAHP